MLCALWGHMAPCVQNGSEATEVNPVSPEVGNAVLAGSRVRKKQAAGPATAKACPRQRERGKEPQGAGRRRPQAKKLNPAAQALPVGTFIFFPSYRQ